jgi:hypothetical protein
MSSLEESIKTVIEADEEVVEALEDSPVKKQIKRIREYYENGEGGDRTPHKGGVQ